MPFTKEHKINLGKHWKLSSKTRKKMSIAQTGRKLSQETRKKMSISHVGKHSRPAPWAKGKNNHMWAGDKPSYSAIHTWLIRWYGRASSCENKSCSFKNPLRFEYALIHEKEYERKRENFVMLCASCHRKYDDSQERRNKISTALRGRRLSQEHRLKVIRNLTHNRNNTKI